MGAVLGAGGVTVDLDLGVLVVFESSLLSPVVAPAADADADDEDDDIGASA